MSLSTRSKRGCGYIVMIKNKIKLLEINKFLIKHKISISEIQKYLSKKKFNLNKKNKNPLNNLGAIPRTFLSSLIIISIFFTLPIVIEFTKERSVLSKNFENNSKNDLKKVLENQGQTLDEELNQKFLFEDILEFDEQPTDTIRLSAITIEELFKSTKYSLKDVRKNKLVKPVTLTLLPHEIKMIENVKRRKDLFIQIILPLIIKENNSIR